MKVNIEYPTTKCKYCGKPFEKKHNRQTYCSEECRKYSRQEKRRQYNYRYYTKNKKRLQHKYVGTRTIGPKPNPDPEREVEIVNNEINRIGLRT